MRASVMEDTTTRVITLDVYGVPDIDGAESWHTRTRMFRPSRVVITIVDDKIRDLKTSGGMIRKDGSVSPMRVTKIWVADNDFFGRGNKLSTAPEWVHRLWEEAPAGTGRGPILNIGSKDKR